MKNEFIDINENSENKEKHKSIIVVIVILAIVVVSLIAILGMYIKKSSESDLKEYNSRMEGLYNNAVSYYENKDYKKALDELNQIENKYEKYNLVIQKEEEIKNAYYNSYIELSGKYLNEKNYSKAIEVLENVDDIFKNSEEIINKINEIKLAEIEDKIKEYADKKDYISVLEYAVSKKKQSNVPKISEKLDETINEYKKKEIEAIKEILKKDYKNASKDVNELIQIMPADNEVLELQKSYSSYKPVLLTSLKYLQISGNTVVKANEDVKDNAENDYTNYIMGSEGISTVSYHLNKEYKRLTSKIGVLFTERLSSVQTIVNIYADDILVYTSPAYTTGVLPADINLDLTGVTVLKIEFIKNSSNNSNAALFDLNLFKY
jgi:tetratricopeptide (TPR) repeat protein